MDSTDPDISFDESGICSRCTSWFDRWVALPKNQPDADVRLNSVVEEIRRRGQGRRYDCVIGLSGGMDSTYLALLIVERFNLRPIAVHMDNGWNTELSVFNVERIVKGLNLDLVTVVLDWDEFRSLQRAFLKASVPDAEIPTDHAIAATKPKPTSAMIPNCRSVLSSGSRWMSIRLPMLQSRANSAR